LTFNRYQIDPETKYVWASSPGTLFYNDDKYGIGTSYSIEEQIRYDFSEDFSLLAGAVASYYDIIPKCTVPGGADPDDDIVSQAGFLSYYTVQGDPDSKVDVPRAHNFTYENYGLYLESQYDLTETLRFVTGVRQDFNSRFDEKPISPRLAAIYQPNNNLTAKYIYTEAYVAPSPYVSYMIADNGTSIFVPAPDLEPEEATSHEINLNYNRKNLLISTSLFFNEQQNILLYDEAAPSDGTIWADAAGTQSRNRKHATNSGRSRTQGFDVFTKYNLQKISLWASYTYVDGDDLPGISDHNVRVGTTYRISNDLTATLSAVFRSTPENLTNLAGLESEVKDPYDLNLHVNYDLNDKTRLFVNVRNLTDNQYALKGVVTPTPQEDIKVVGGLTMRF
jgi:outer membrane receptor protein involved in Fe transport